MIVYCILTGFSLNSFAILGASFFRRAQLSGITVTVFALVLGVAAQISAKTLSTSAVIFLSIFFTPMTFVFHMIWLARFEHKQISPNLLDAAPTASWKVPGLVFWFFMLFQTIIYLVLAAYVERGMFYKNSHGRKIVYDDSSSPIILSNFTKHYFPNWWFRLVAPLFGIKKTTVHAVQDLSLAPMKGQIMVLVGANGCGKSTTLVRLNICLSGTLVLTAFRMPSPVLVMLQVVLLRSTAQAVLASVHKRYVDQKSCLDSNVLTKMSERLVGALNRGSARPNL